MAKLHARGVLDEITHAEAHEDEQKAAVATHSAEEVAAEAVDVTSPTRETKRPNQG
jgi:hypothetical protein